MAKNTATAEFQELSAFLGFFFDRYMSGGQPHTAEVHPLTVLREMTERSPKKALGGLRMAIDDCIDVAARWPPERVREVDEALQLADVVTLSELRRRYWRKFKALVERGSTISQSEYYPVKGITFGSLASAEQLLRTCQQFCVRGEVDVTRNGSWIVTTQGTRGQAPGSV